MGTLRTLFAIAVVFAHSYGFVFVGGQNAVQLFYMISGFLISYILVEKKAYPSIRRFYINRYLRIYPIYFTVALLSLLAFTFALAIGKNVNFFKVYLNSTLTANLLLIFSNATIFLQDWVMFLGIQNNELIFTTDFRKSDVVLYPALILPQAWTLGVELTFYLVAPFILTKKRFLLILLTLSIALRFYLIYIGLGENDPWTYRFFPTELALFLLGSLAHQVLRPYYQKKIPETHIKKYANISTYTLILITLLYWLIPVNEAIKTIIFFSIFLIFMPLTFIFQSNHDFDKWIGNLSYPIYICHILIIYIVSFIQVRIDISNKAFISICAVVLSIGFSITLNAYIANPIESLRNRFRTNTN